MYYYCLPSSSVILYLREETSKFSFCIVPRYQAGLFLLFMACVLGWVLEKGREGLCCGV